MLKRTALILALVLLLIPAAYPQTVLLGGMDFDGGEVFVGGDFIDYGTGFNHFLTSDFAVSVDLSRLLSLADQTTHAILATADAGTATFVIQAEGPAGSSPPAMECFLAFGTAGVEVREDIAADSHSVSCTAGFSSAGSTTTVELELVVDGQVVDVGSFLVPTVDLTPPALPITAGAEQLAPSVYWKFADLEIENLSASFGR